MNVLRIDLETFSEIPIKNGAHAYAEKAEIMLWAYALDDAPIKVWDVTADPVMPNDLKVPFSDPSVIIEVHNAGFDRTILEKCGFNTALSRWRCTMARAYAHGLPGSLDALCDIFKLSVDKAKDKEGKKLIQLFCVPRKTGAVRRATRETHPAEWQRFVEYARLDIAAAREISRLLPQWNYSGDELSLWHLDQAINNRGFRVDVELAQAAIHAVGRAQEILASRTNDLSLGDLESTTQRDETLRHILEAYGVTLPDLTMSTVERRMEDPDLPVELKELLGIRLQASSTSTAKYKRLMNCVSSDGRLRGTMQYCGASRTGRWGGRLFQPHNLMRPTLTEENINFGIETLKADCEDLFFDNVMEVASNAIRGCIITSENKKLVAADLSSIEGRVLPWLADEQPAVDAYRAYDAGTGPDVYVTTYAQAFRIDPKDVTKFQRQIGKVMVLMLGFGGSAGAFVTGAAAYKIDLDEMARGLFSSIPTEIKAIAEASYEWALVESVKAGKDLTYGLQRETYIVCRSLVEMWRRKNPDVVKFWSVLGNSVEKAIENKGKEYTTKKLSQAENYGIRVRCDGNWLRLILPSGRSLCYAAPRVKNGEISYMGVNQYSRKWERVQTYAGKLAENVTQAVARDIMAANMPRIEEAGYKILFTCHDEVVTETPDISLYNAGELSDLLATNPPWATGLPLAAKGFEARRYKKAD